MIFPAPIFLYLLPLAGLPIVFHFILKQKKRTMVFSTLMFFHRTDPKLNSHRKIRQWLLLLLRILLIAFILLALSRPIFQTSGGLSGKISVVAIVDNSGSMSDGAGYDNDRTKLECAVGAARRLITMLEDGSEAAVVLLVDDPAVEPAEGRSDRNPVLVGDRLTTDKESLLALLDRIRPTQATGDAGRALARAFGFLRASSAGGGAVHVFSDLQQTEWGTDSKRSGVGGAPITVYVHKIEPEIRDEANVAITAIQLPGERILPEHTYSIGLVLQNTSDTVANIRVNSIDSQDSKNTENVTLARGRTETVEVETKPDENGYHWIKVWIEGDGFSADNEAGVGIFCEETATIMFWGTPEEFGVLPVALSPSGQGQFTGMVAEFRSPGQLSQTAAEEKPIMIVATWMGLQLMGESSVPLREYVDKGGNLLVVPSVKPGRRVVSGQLPDWLGAALKAREVYPRGVSLEVLDDRTTFWHRIRDATAGSKLEPVRAYVFHPLGLTDEFTPLEIPETGVKPQKGRFLTGFKPLLGVDSERVVIAHRKLGQGNIYVSGTAFAPQWNTLPLTGLLVVMTQRMALGGGSSEGQRTLSLVAGERPRGIIAEGSPRESGDRLAPATAGVEILSLVGDPMDWKGEGQEIPAFPRAGVYLVRTDDDKYCISVRASEKEGLEKFVEGSQVPIIGQIAHKILPYDEAEDFGQHHKGQARAIESYLFLLLLATLALLAEGWLGSHKPSRAGSAGLDHARLRRAGQSTATYTRVTAGASEEKIAEGETVPVAPVNRLGRKVRRIIGKSPADKTTGWRAG